MNLVFELLSRRLWIWRVARPWPWLLHHVFLGHVRDVVKNQPQLLPELKTMLNARKCGEEPARALDRRALLSSKER